ncbi:hypothetical protein [Actinacidiphila paucisporea]|uniref:Uncharacterized protein n=1 Tax=Actinacidiphila paucisporea TaxID=310782 RepID=A0A1M7NM97_9ACTN|nr:hypothetical protein [Actinacidiphila paucisporea]SHN05062.1 hypothetical protein SAMN05216499_11952 [Actinacidiphila paucisporea]
MTFRRKPPDVGRRKSAALLLALGTAVAGAALAGPGAGVGQASSHREAPLTASLEGATPGHLVQALAAGDRVNGPGRLYTGSFPYIALPFTNAVNQAG